MSNYLPKEGDKVWGIGIASGDRYEGIYVGKRFGDRDIIRDTEAGEVVVREIYPLLQSNARIH